MLASCRLHGLLLASSFVLALVSPAQTKVSDLQDRIQAQNSLFEGYFQIQLKESPEMATSLGANRYNALLTDDSLAGVRRRHLENVRERAKAQLGTNFDIKAFHDEILSGGGMPLDLLDARITRWIATQLPAIGQR